MVSIELRADRHSVSRAEMGPGGGGGGEVAAEEPLGTKPEDIIDFCGAEACEGLMLWLGETWI